MDYLTAKLFMFINLIFLALPYTLKDFKEVDIMSPSQTLFVSFYFDALRRQTKYFCISQYKILN
jgi:hypothetical protein